MAGDNARRRTEAPLQVKCTKCLQPIGLTDVIESHDGRLSHVDCNRPLMLTPEERALVFVYCSEHVLAQCPACGSTVRSAQLSKDFVGASANRCPKCRRDLTEEIRAHLFSCGMLPAEIRRRAQGAREAAQRLLKESQQLRDRSDVLIREAEAGLFAGQRALKEAMASRISPRSDGQIFPGDSELAGLMRALDWSKTDLGAPERWPANLRVAVSLCLTSRLPVVVYWGPHHTALYNDAYVSFLGPGKHPRSLGRPGQECWREIWDTIGPMLEGVRYTASSTLSNDVRMFFARALPLEEVYVRFTFGPILGPDGRKVDGIFCPCTETTEQVVGARRLETLRRLGVRPVGARSTEEAAAAAADALADNPHDVPYAAVYGIDDAETKATRLATSGPPESIDRLPLTVDLDDAVATPWPLAAVARTMLAADAHGDGLVLPIPGAVRHRLGGLLAVGVSPHRPLDQAYRAFLHSAAVHVGAGIEEARAFEEADRRKNEFLAILSQELRGPLAPLGTMVEVLRRSPGDGDVVRQAHGTIERQFSQLVRVVDELLHRETGEAARPAPSPEKGVAKPLPPPRRILIVDDDSDSRTALSMLLTLAGNETHTAQDGLEAVKAAELLQPEVVLMDLGMPKLSGVEAVRRIRAQSWGKDMLIVALTGRGQDADKRTSKDAGFDAHMVKPVDHEALMDVLATMKESA